MDEQLRVETMSFVRQGRRGARSQHPVFRASTALGKGTLNTVVPLSSVTSNVQSNQPGIVKDGVRIRSDTVGEVLRP